MSNSKISFAHEVAAERSKNAEKISFFVTDDSVREFPAIARELRLFDVDATKRLKSISLDIFTDWDDLLDDDDDELARAASINRIKAETGDFFDAIAELDGLEHLSFSERLDFDGFLLEKVTKLIFKVAPRLKTLYFGYVYATSTHKEFQGFLRALERAEVLQTYEMADMRWKVHDRPDQKPHPEIKILRAALKHSSVVNLSTVVRSGETWEDYRSAIPSLQSIRSLEVQFEGNASTKGFFDDDNQFAGMNDKLEALSIDITCCSDNENPAPILHKMAAALSRGNASALKTFKVEASKTSEFEAFDLGVLDAFGKSLRSNYNLQTLSLIQHTSTPWNFTQLRTPEIDLYLRLNRHGRKALMTDPWSVPRTKWVNEIIYFCNDLDAMFYYLRANPWLLDAHQTTKTAPPVKKRSVLPDGTEDAHGNKRTKLEFDSVDNSLEHASTAQKAAKDGGAQSSKDEETKRLKQENEQLRRRIEALERQMMPSG